MLTANYVNYLRSITNHVAVTWPRWCKYNTELYGTFPNLRHYIS